jgi:hypothetical protein
MTAALPSESNAVTDMSRQLLEIVFWYAPLHRKVIVVEITARADLPIKYEFSFGSGWRRLVA